MGKKRKKHRPAPVPAAPPKPKVPKEAYIDFTQAILGTTLTQWRVLRNDGHGHITNVGLLTVAFPHGKAKPPRFSSAVSETLDADELRAVIGKMEYLTENPPKPLREKPREHAEGYGASQVRFQEGQGKFLQPTICPGVGKPVLKLKVKGERLKIAHCPECGERLKANSLGKTPAHRSNETERTIWREKQNQGVKARKPMTNALDTVPLNEGVVPVDPEVAELAKRYAVNGKPKGVVLNPPNPGPARPPAPGGSKRKGQGKATPAKPTPRSKGRPDAPAKGKPDAVSGRGKAPRTAGKPRAGGRAVRAAR